MSSCNVNKATLEISPTIYFTMSHKYCGHDPRRSPIEQLNFVYQLLSFVLAGNKDALSEVKGEVGNFVSLSSNQTFSLQLHSQKRTSNLGTYSFVIAKFFCYVT